MRQIKLFNKFFMYEGVSTLLEFLDGKFTHYVALDCNGIPGRIAELKYKYHMLKFCYKENVLSVELTMGRGGCDIGKILLFHSAEEAKKEISKYIIKELELGKHDSRMLSIAKSYKIQLPLEAIETQRKRKIENLNSRKKQWEEELLVLNDEYVKIESEYQSSLKENLLSQSNEQKDSE